MAPIVQYPLEKITVDQLQLLGKSLWSWSPSKDCNTVQCSGCETDSCLARRAKRLAQLFLRYKELTSLYEPDDTDSPALSSHNELFKMMERLKEIPDISRSLLVQKLFPHIPNHTSPSIADINRALNLAIRVMFMVNCSAQRQTFGILEHGLPRVEWRNESTLAEFILNIFPMTDHPVINDNDAASILSMKSALMARKLKKVAGLKFRGTDDLSSHLKLDRKAGILEIFHHTAFLKEHLRLTKNLPADTTIVDSLKRGALPRQLVLETLDSIQKILFPLSDSKSYSLLRSLTSTASESFDPDCLRFESASIRGAHERDIQYQYFGSRLADLYEESNNPIPRGWMERWLERKSRARHVMMATIIGAVIAVFLGLASLGVGGYQAWVGYQQWQHPVSSNNN